MKTPRKKNNAVVVSPKLSRKYLHDDASNFFLSSSSYSDQTRCVLCAHRKQTFFHILLRPRGKHRSKILWIKICMESQAEAKVDWEKNDEFGVNTKLAFSRRLRSQHATCRKKIQFNKLKNSLVHIFQFSVFCFCGWWLSVADCSTFCFDHQVAREKGFKGSGETSRGAQRHAVQGEKVWLKDQKDIKKRLRNEMLHEHPKTPFRVRLDDRRWWFFSLLSHKLVQPEKSSREFQFINKFSTSMKFPLPRVSSMNVWKISKHLIFFFFQQTQRY